MDQAGVLPPRTRWLSIQSVVVREIPGGTQHSPSGRAVIGTAGGLAWGKTFLSRRDCDIK